MDVPTVIVGEASSTPRWGTAVDVPTVAVGEGGSEGPSMEVDVPRWAVMWDGVGTLVGVPGASASAPRIGVTAAEGTLCGLRGATASAALLSALGPRGVLEKSALGP